MCQAERIVRRTRIYLNTWPTVIWPAVRGQVDLDGLISGRVDLDHVADALAPDPADQHVKIIVRPSGGLRGEPGRCRMRPSPVLRQACS